MPHFLIVLYESWVKFSLYLGLWFTPISLMIHFTLYVYESPYYPQIWMPPISTEKQLYYWKKTHHLVFTRLILHLCSSCKKEERNHHTCNQYKITKLEHSSNYKTNLSKTWSFESTYYCTSRAQAIFVTWRSFCCWLVH